MNTPTTTDRPSVLAIDRDPNVRRLLHVTLRSIADVASASSRIEAETALTVQRFSAAVTHLGVGYLGYEWIDHLIEREGLPVVVVTGYVLQRDLAPIHPAAHVVPKPFQPVELRKLVGALIADS